MEIDIKIKKRLGDFTLSVEFSGDIKRLGILGGSGCGKSMTLRCIAGIERPDEGHIAVGGRTFFDSKSGTFLPPAKRNAGYLFQNYALFPAMNVRENIGAGLKCSKAERAGKVDAMVEAFRLEGLEELLPGQLSGGQQQRVALARMLILEPGLIMLDEPFSALDVYLKDTLIQEMDERLSAYEVPVIMVSHSRDEIYRLCDMTAIMETGKIVTYGLTDEVFKDPVYTKAAALTGCKNIFPVKRVDEHTLELTDWGAVLSLKRSIPGECSHIGIRAHDLLPVYDEDSAGLDCIRVGRVSSATLQFERQFYISPYGKDLTQEKRLRYFVQRESRGDMEKRGMPGYLRIPEDKVMLLREL